MKSNNLKAFSELTQSIYSALGTYSNVHRGSGHKSMVTTYLYEKASYQLLSSCNTGLPLGIRALVVRRNSLPRGIPFQTGGGTTRLIAPGWVVWAKAPEKYLCK